MSISAANQSFIFLHCITCGVLIGVIFDIFRIIRQIIPSGTTATFIEDLLFWILALGVVCYCILILNYGIIRWYIYASIGLGALLYFATLSRIIIPISILIIRLIKKSVSFIIMVLLIPVKFAAKILKKPLFFVVNISKNSFKKLKFNCNIFNKYLIHKRIRFKVNKFEEQANDKTRVC